MLKAMVRVQGTLAEYLTLPASNLHVVPDGLTDQEACFAEPLAAACRIAEQQVSSSSSHTELLPFVKCHGMHGA